MNYLIDGHNLIGKVADIKLSDPDDEAKLTLRLINWAAVGKNRRVIVVFDGGTHGTNWSAFKSDRVKVVFVPTGKTADAWLIRFMLHEVKDVKAFHLVSSDNAIIRQAQNRRVAFTRSDVFADQLAAERANLSELGTERVEDRPKEAMQSHQVDAWLQLFGGEPELEVKPYQRRKEAAPEPEVADPDVRPKTSDDPADYLLSTSEVGAWLDLFGGEPEIMTQKDASTRSKHTDAGQSRKQAVKPRKGPKVSDDSVMSQDDVDLWHTLFGE